MFDFQKTPAFFAIFAWLMQLSVFLTPILEKNPEIGNGICEEFAVFSNQQLISHDHQYTQQNHDTTNNHMHHHMHMNHAEHGSKPSSMHESACKFCLIFHLIFNPILIAFVLALILYSLFKKIKINLPEYHFNLHQKLYLILFQNRAPPLLVL